MKVSAVYTFRRTSLTKKSFSLLHMLNSSIYLDNIWQFYHIWNFFSLYRLFGLLSLLTFSATATPGIRCNLLSWDTATSHLQGPNPLFIFTFFFFNRFSMTTELYSNSKHKLPSERLQTFSVIPLWNSFWKKWTTASMGNLCKSWQLQVKCAPSKKFS